MNKGVLEDIFISQQLRYYDITNIFFDAPINDTQVNDLKEIMFSINSINQMYFKDTVDLNSIEIVKCLLDISPTMNDKSVEKFILNSDMLNIDDFLNINFSNEETWFIMFNYINDKSKLLSFTDYKFLNNELNNIFRALDIDNDSQIEKIIKIYDYCKSKNIDDDINLNLVNSIKYAKYSKNNLIILFQLLLKKCKIKSYVGSTINENEKNSALIIDVNDNKYNIDGIYLFDIFSDYLYKGDVPEKLRTINYNFFCIKLGKYSDTVFKDSLDGVLKYLSHDLEYDLEKINSLSKNEIKSLELSLGLNYVDIHNRIYYSPGINENLLISIVSRNNELHEIIKENYLARKDLLHKYNIVKLKNT